LEGEDIPVDLVEVLAVLFEHCVTVLEAAPAVSDLCGVGFYQPVQQAARGDPLLDVLLPGLQGGCEAAVFVDF
jgi:hypothetical protein